MVDGGELSDLGQVRNSRNANICLY